MKIAFYFTSEISPNQGGTERVTYAVASYLKKSGFECIFIAHKNTGRQISYDFEQFFLPDSETLICDRNISYTRKLLKTKNVDIIINQDSFDKGNKFCSRLYFSDITCITVIHYNLFGSAIHVGESLKESHILKKSSLIKYGIQRIGIAYYRHKAVKARARMLQDIYNTSDYVVLLSQADLRDYPVANKSRLHVITNPLTLEAPKEKAVKEKMVLSVGRQVFSQKKTDLLLKAWKIIERRHPDWKLDILGDGSCLEYFKKLAKLLDLSNVTFHGNQAPESYYEKASILCMTSSYEGFGLVLTEGMQSGVVPVAFNSFEAINEIICDGIDGVLVKPFNVKEYADAVCDLIEHDTMRCEMARKAITKAQNFSIEKIGQEWIDFLNNISR